MNTQQNKEELKKKGYKVNPSRDIDYPVREKDFSGEFEEQDAKGDAEVNPGKLDETEVDLDRGQKEFSGGGEENKQDKQAGGMSSDLGGDVSKTSGPVKH